MATDSNGSVSRLIVQWKAPNEPATIEEVTEELWRRVSARLVELARRKMKTRVGLADEEDLALSTFHHVYRAMRAGKYDWVDDRNALWRLFMTITAEKVSKFYRNMKRQKRDYRRTKSEADLPNPAGNDSERAGLLNNVAGATLDPLETIMVEDLLEKLMAAIRDPQIAEVARLRLEGYTNREIARRLGLAEKTIERKTRIIRETWLSFAHDDEDSAGGGDSDRDGDGDGGGKGVEAPSKPTQPGLNEHAR